MFNLRDQNYTYKSIATVLNEEGLFNRGGKPWKYHSVRNKILYRKKYLKQDGGEGGFDEDSEAYEYLYSHPDKSTKSMEDNNVISSNIASSIDNDELC